MSAASSFSPDWVSAPGQSIIDALAFRNLSVEDFGAKIGLSTHATGKLLTGDIEIDVSMADALSINLGASRQFWLSRERLYRERLGRAGRGSNAGFSAFKSSLPIKDMKAFGWLVEFEGQSDEDAVRGFFEDAPGAWMATGPGLMEQVRFRTSFAHKTNPAAVAAWLRQGVRLARNLDCARWNPQELAGALGSIRTLTRVKKPSEFFPRLVEIGRQCGVAFVFARTPNGCRASGATHFDNADKAIVQLSFRHRSDDHFWFTVFHEIGHLLLHPNSPLFVEGQDYEMTEEESEANDFASSVLVPTEFEPELASVQRRDYRAMMRLARRMQISPGILVGQMQHRGYLQPGQMNFLKERYDWNAIEGVTL